MKRLIDPKSIHYTALGKYRNKYVHKVTEEILINALGGMVARKEIQEWRARLAEIIAVRVWWKFKTFQWKHVALVRSGTIQGIHIDGKLEVLYDKDGQKIDIPPPLGDGDFTVDFWMRIRTFNPKAWTTAQHFAFARHFRRVA